MCLAVPGRVVEVLAEEPSLRWASVEFGGLRQKVALACVPEARPGDYVLVHAGIALSVVDEVEAKTTLAMIAELGGKPDAAPG